MAQSHGMSNRKAIGLEGVAVKYYKQEQQEEDEPPVNKEQLEFFTYYSSSKEQSARTSYIHTCNMLSTLQSSPYSLLQRFSGAMFYEQSDGCAAQYTSATAIKYLILIANHFGIIVNKMISCPQHGKDIVDAINGASKSRFRKHENTADKGKSTIDNATFDGDSNKEIDPVFVVVDRIKKDREKQKPKKQKDNELHINRYHDIAIDCTKQRPIAPTTTFTASIEDAKVTYKEGNRTRTYPHQGQKDHYHIYTDWRIPIDQCAMRRFPCDCEACHKQITLPWDDKIPKKDWYKQKRFHKVHKCILEPVFGGLNKWKPVKLALPKQGDAGIQRKEIQALLASIPSSYEERAREDIVMGGYGAMDTTDKHSDGYYLIKWWSDPYPLQEDSGDVEGCLEIMPKDTWVCDDQYLDRLHRHKHWYKFNNKAPVKTYRLQYIINGNIDLIQHKDGGDKKPNLNSKHFKQLKAKDVFMVGKRDQYIIQEEKGIRNNLDYIEEAESSDEEESDSEGEIGDEPGDESDEEPESDSEDEEDE